MGLKVLNIIKYHIISDTRETKIGPMLRAGFFLGGRVRCNYTPKKSRMDILVIFRCLNLDHQQHSGYKAETNTKFMHRLPQKLFGSMSQIKTGESTIHLISVHQLILQLSNLIHIRFYMK